MIQRVQHTVLLLSLLMTCSCVFQIGYAASFASRPPVQLRMDSGIGGKIGDILSLTLEIANGTDEAFQGTIRIFTPTGMHLFGDEVRSIDLEAKGKRFVPLRMRLEQTVSAGESPIKIHLFNTEGQLVDSLHSTVQVARHRHVFMQATSRQEQMQFPGDSIRIPLYVRNAGNTDETVRLLFSAPLFEGNPGRDFEAIELELPPSQDTTFVLGFVTNARMLQQEQFFIHVTGLYEDNDIFGNAHIHIQNVASRRSYSQSAYEFPIWATQQNQLQLSTRNLLAGSQTWQLQGRANHRFPQGTTLSYQFNAQQWGGLDQALYLNNTWVRLDHRNRGLTLGNLSENLDKYLHGRGLKVHFGDSLRNWTTEMGFMDKGYHLIGEPVSSHQSDGYSVFLRSEHGMGVNSRFSYRTMALLDRDPFENAESALYVNDFRWTPDATRQQTYLQLQLGTGLSRQINGRETVQPSLSAMASVNTQWKQYSFTSDNYFSSPYYPGARRGTIQLNQRIARKAGKAGQSTLWAGLHLSDYQPSYFSSAQVFPVYFHQSRAEVGASIPLGSRMLMHISPRYEFERGRYVQASAQAEILEQQSVKLTTTWNWRSQNSRHFTSFSQETGWLTDWNVAGNPEKLHFRSTLSYSYARFNLTAFHQYGHFSVSEHLYGLESKRIPSNTSIHANWSGQFLRKRLHADLGASYHRDALYGSGISANNRLQYNFETTALFAHTQWFQLKNDHVRSTPAVYTQLGVIQKLPQSTKAVRTKRGRMEFFVFYDENNNGIFDEGDRVASGKRVLINQTLFLADQKGVVQYSRVPYDHYRLNVPVENGWYAPVQVLTVDQRVQRWDIPLQKSGTLRGELIFRYDPLLSRETNVDPEGYTITARASNGATFSTRTDNRGQYLLFLPVGEYEIFLNEQEFPAYVFSENSRQTTRIESGTLQKIPPFELKIQQKTIEVKRFGT